MLRKTLASVTNYLEETLYLLVCQAEEFFQANVHSKNRLNLQQHRTLNWKLLLPHLHTFILTSNQIHVYLITTQTNYIAFDDDATA